MRFFFLLILLSQSGFSNPVCKNLFELYQSPSTDKRYTQILLFLKNYNFDFNNTLSIDSFLNIFPNLLAHPYQFTEDQDLYQAEYASLASHSERNVTLTVNLGKILNLSERELNYLKVASLLHDIGKISLPRSILNKPSALTEEEHKIMQTHPTIGAEIAKLSNFPIEVIEIIEWHHKDYNGGGYPALKGPMPILASILSIVDRFDARSEKRVYRPTSDPYGALSEILKNKGLVFDPKVVKAFQTFSETSEFHDFIRRNY